MVSKVFALTVAKFDEAHIDAVIEGLKKGALPVSSDDGDLLPISEVLHWLNGEKDIPIGFDRRPVITSGDTRQIERLKSLAEKQRVPIYAPDDVIELPQASVD